MIEILTNIVRKWKKNGTWGGHMEIFALSSVLDRSFSIYNENQEIQVVKATESSQAMMLYLAYDRTKFHYSALIQSE